MQISVYHQSGYPNSAQPTYLWCNRCYVYHSFWEEWEETRWFMDYKNSMRMAEAFEKYFEEKVMEKWGHE